MMGLEYRFLFMSNIHCFTELQPQLEFCNLAEGIIFFPRMSVLMTLILPGALSN